MSEPKPPRGQWSESNVGANYTDEEREFLRAMEHYKRKNRRPFPTWREVLAVVKSLGYQKTPNREA